MNSMNLTRTEPVHPSIEPVSLVLLSDAPLCSRVRDGALAVPPVRGGRFDRSVNAAARRWRCFAVWADVTRHCTGDHFGVRAGQV